MKTKIISEGVGRETKIINAETGERVENVTAIHWFCAANGCATATLEFIAVEADLIGETDQKIDIGPVTEKQKNYHPPMETR